MEGVVILLKRVLSLCGRGVHFGWGVSIFFGCIVIIRSYSIKDFNELIVLFWGFQVILEW